MKTRDTNGSIASRHRNLVVAKGRDMRGDVKDPSLKAMRVALTDYHRRQLAY